MNNTHLLTISVERCFIVKMFKMYIENGIIIDNSIITCDVLYMINIALHLQSLKVHDFNYSYKFNLKRDGFL